MAHRHWSDEITPSPRAFIEPMLLLRTDALPEGPQWLYELKLDGYRAVAFKRNAAVQLRSRNDNDFNARYPAVVEALAKLPDNTIMCPFANLPEAKSGRWGQGLTKAKMAECVWLKPVLVGQFEFVEWTSDDHLRHSKFIGLREPIGCTRD